MELLDAPLLDYAAVTDPDPLQITPEGGDPADSTLTVVVSNGTQAFIDVQHLVFTVPVGPDAKDLTGDASGIEVLTPDGWTVSRQGGVFTVTPKTTADGRVGPQGLTFTFTAIHVNDQVGTFDLGIAETTQQGGSRDARLALAKFPEAFRVSALNATPLVVRPGQSTTLSWNGSDQARYTLLYDETTVPDLPHAGTYTVDDLQVTTVFDLVAEATVNQQTVTIERERTVTVNRVEILAFQGPEAVLPDRKVTLSWKTLNADSCELYAGADLIDGNAPANTDGYEVALAGNPTNYVLIGQAAGNRRSNAKLVTVYAVAYAVEATVALPGMATTTALAPSGETLYASYVQRTDLALVSTASHTVVGSIDLGYAPAGASILASPDGSRLYAGSNSATGVVAIVDLATKAVVETITVPGAESMALSADGRTLYAYSHDDGTLSTIDTASAKVVHTMVLEPAARGVVPYPDGTSLLIVYPGSLQRVDLDTNTPVLDVPSTDDLAGWAAFSQDGASIYVTTNGTDLLVVDAATLATSGRIAVGTTTAGIALDPGLTAAVVALSGSNQVALLDTATGFLVQRVDVGTLPLTLVLSADGRTVYVANVSGKSISVLSR